MVAPASIANASVQVDSFDLADSITSLRNGAFITGGVDGGGGPLAPSAGNRRSSGSAATLGRAVSAVMAVSLAATGCQLDADGGVSVVPAGLPSSGALGTTGGAGILRSGGPGIAKSGAGTRSRVPGTAASTVSSVAAAAQRRTSLISGVNSSTTSDPASSSPQANDAPAKTDAVITTDLPPLDAATRAQASRVFASRALLNSLELVERAVQQNLYHEAHRRYRGGPAIDIVEGLLAAGSFSCDAI